MLRDHADFICSDLFCKSVSTLIGFDCFMVLAKLYLYLFFLCFVFFYCGLERSGEVRRRVEYRNPIKIMCTSVL
jgi:hypothetical protein